MAVNIAFVSLDNLSPKLGCNCIDDNGVHTDFCARVSFPQGGQAPQAEVTYLGTSAQSSPCFPLLFQAHFRVGCHPDLEVCDKDSFSLTMLKDCLLSHRVRGGMNQGQVGGAGVKAEGRTREKGGLPCKMNVAA